MALKFTMNQHSNSYRDEFICGDMQNWNYKCLHDHHLATFMKNTCLQIYQGKAFNINYWWGEPWNHFGLPQLFVYSRESYFKYGIFWNNLSFPRTPNRIRTLFHIKMNIEFWVKVFLRYLPFYDIFQLMSQNDQAERSSLWI